MDLARTLVLSVAAVLLLVIPGVALYIAWLHERRQHRLLHGLCTGCGYDLGGGPCVLIEATMDVPGPPACANGSSERPGSPWPSWVLEPGDSRATRTDQ